MNQKNTKGIRFPSNGLNFLLINLLLGFLMTIGSMFFQRNPEPACHGAGLGAGFPLPYVCDDSGGSPISSWGRIDLSDLYNIDWRMFLLDFLIYNALAALAWSAALGLVHKTESSHWALVLCITFILGFLFAFLSFQSGNLTFDALPPHTPTPILYTPTPFGTPTFPYVAPT